MNQNNKPGAQNPVTDGEAQSSRDAEPSGHADRKDSPSNANAAQAQPKPQQGGARGGSGGQNRQGRQGQGQGQGQKPNQNGAPNQGKTGQNQPNPNRSGPQRRRPVVQVKPIARPARMRRRHRGLLVSFLFLVCLPIALMSYYLWVRSVDQYASTTAFTVQRETGGSAVDLLGGLSQLSGGGSSSDTDILYEFIQSQELVRRVDAVVDLRAHYTQHWGTDPLFSLKPDATLEDLVKYWQRIVRISYDQSASLIELRVLAFDAQTAQSIAEEVVDESQSMINALNAAARDDTIRYALFDLEEALDRLKTAREALTAFRTRTQIVDPSADIQGRMGVLNNLQQQLAEALIEFDILSETTKRTDPRLQQAERRIEVIQSRIAQERLTFATAEAGQNGEDYPTLMAEFESLTVDREFSEEAYRAALAAVEIARSNAARKSRYLATYIAPTLAETAQYPQRITWTLLTALFSLLLWSICVLVYYSIRDRH